MTLSLGLVDINRYCNCMVSTVSQTRPIENRKTESIGQGSGLVVKTSERKSFLPCYVQEV